MARQTKIQELQEYADEIWSEGEYIVRFVAADGYSLRDNVTGRSRPIGRNANEAHAELDAMSDLAKAQQVAILRDVSIPKDHPRGRNVLYKT